MLDKLKCIKNKHKEANIQVLVYVMTKQFYKHINQKVNFSVLFLDFKHKKLPTSSQKAKF